MEEDQPTWEGAAIQVVNLVAVQVEAGGEVLPAQARVVIVNARSAEPEQHINLASRAVKCSVRNVVPIW